MPSPCECFGKLGRDHLRGSGEVWRPDHGNVFNTHLGGLYVFWSYEYLCGCV